MKTEKIRLDSKMKVTILLADYAEVVGGKLYIMGGGWSITSSRSQSAIAVKIDVPWNQANHKHEIKFELLDADYRPVIVPTPAGESPLIISGGFEVGRPAGLLQGSSIDVPIAFNIQPIPLEPARRYIWRLTIDEKTEETWQVVFSTRPSPTLPPQ